VILGVNGVGRVPGQLSTNVIDIHRRSLAGCRPG
jgi:hypothetical protein